MSAVAYSPNDFGFRIDRTAEDKFVKTHFQMIKRLKWNVLYHDDADEYNSDSSDDSVQIGTSQATEALKALAENDPQLQDALQRLNQDGFLSDSEKQQDEANENDIVDDTESDGQESEQLKEGEYHEWKECQLCPGARFLNDNDVELHLNSKRHQKALKRFERKQNETTVTQQKSSNQSQEENQENSDIQKDDAPELNGKEQTSKDRKRKMRAKRKLKALKRKKWEKMQQQKMKEQEYTSNQTTTEQKSEDCNKNHTNSLHEQKINNDQSQVKLDQSAKKRKNKQITNQDQTPKRQRKKKSAEKNVEEKHVHDQQKIMSKSEQVRVDSVQVICEPVSSSRKVKNKAHENDIKLEPLEIAKIERKKLVRAKREKVRQKQRRVSNNELATF